MKNVFYMDCNVNVELDKSCKLKTTIFKNLSGDTFFMKLLITTSDVEYVISATDNYKRKRTD